MAICVCVCVHNGVQKTHTHHLAGRQAKGANTIDSAWHRHCGVDQTALSWPQLLSQLLTHTRTHVRIDSCQWRNFAAGPSPCPSPRLAALDQLGISPFQLCSTVCYNKRENSIIHGITTGDVCRLCNSCM